MPYPGSGELIPVMGGPRSTTSPLRSTKTEQPIRGLLSQGPPVHEQQLSEASSSNVLSPTNRHTSSFIFPGTLGFPRTINLLHTTQLQTLWQRHTSLLFTPGIHRPYSILPLPFLHTPSQPLRRGTEPILHTRCSHNS